MSATNKTPKPAKAKRISKNLSLQPAVIEQGEWLAKLERRDFSSQVEVLIEAEFTRRRNSVAA